VFFCIVGESVLPLNLGPAVPLPGRLVVTLDGGHRFAIAACHHVVARNAETFEIFDRSFCTPLTQRHVVLLGAAFVGVAGDNCLCVGLDQGIGVAAEHGLHVASDARAVEIEVDRLELALDRLPEGMRRVLVLHDVEGYTHEEIGELTGVTSGTSKSQLFKARSKMRHMLSHIVAPHEERKESGTWST